MYITVHELGVPEEVLIRLTDDEGAGSVNEDRAQAAIAASQALVDAALSRVVGVPLQEPSELVKKLACDIALYFLYMRVGCLTAEARARYDDAVSVLDRVADGRLSIAPGGVTAPEFTSQCREFSREFMEGL